jgi:putative membrane protein
MEPSPPKSRSMQDYLRLVLTGAAMGIADLIPGVSGGTMAFILGIYEELLNAIKSFNLRMLQLLAQLKIREALAQVPWLFLIPLGFGLLGAALSMARTIQFLLETQPVYLFSFFFGLVLASVLTVGLSVRWSPAAVVALIAGTIGAYLIVGLVPLQAPHDPISLFLSGSVAIMAMILPGISGSFILLILGQYAYVLNAVSDLDILTILPVAAGAVVGLLFFARLLSWLLDHYHAVTVAALVGFMAGSLRKIWPWKDVLETTLDRHGEIIPIREANILPPIGTELWIALTLCIVGFLLLNYVDHLQHGANPIFRPILGPRREAREA